MAIIRIYSGPDGQSHFEDVELRFEPRGDQSETAELIPGSGIVVRRFDPQRSNPWHHAPGRYAVFTLSGAVDIEIGDSTVRRLGPGDILIAEDRTGQGHVTREVGPARACRSSSPSASEKKTLPAPPHSSRTKNDAPCSQIGPGPPSRRCPPRDARTVISAKLAVCRRS